MSTITLSTKLTTNPDFNAFHFYVESGRAFESADFADAYQLNVHDIDPESISAVQDAAARLNDGEWLFVDFEIAA